MSNSVSARSQAVVSDVSFSDQVTVTELGPARVLLMSTTAQEVVSLYGSIRSNPDFSTDDELIQEVVVGLLDKGTEHRDRFEVAEVLENRGAELDFSNEGLIIEFSGRALREHVGDVLQIMAEQLREPLLDEVEFEKTRAQFGASLHRELERTGSQASSALSRRIYEPTHPNYAPPTQDTLARLEEFTIQAVRDYHSSHFGANDLTLILAGDLDEEPIRAAIEEVFSDWHLHRAPERFDRHAESLEPGRSLVNMPGKRNIDVRIGHGLALKRHHEDYIPLFLGNFILGGNFSARLMTIIRDDMGLTYGIGSSFKGITTELEGHWQIDVTLSQENLDVGLEATLAQVQDFVEHGVTEHELEDVKQTVIGAFKVGLATTRGLAHVLHLNELRGFGPEYLDRFPEEVAGVTVDHVNTAISTYFHPDRFQVALAGGLAEMEETTPDRL